MPPPVSGKQKACSCFTINGILQLDIGQWRHLLSTMHEQSIVASLLDLALEKAAKAGAGKICRIYLVVGELSGVVEESVNFYFNFLREGTIAAEASLFFMRTPAELRCRNCGTVFIAEKLDFHCPDCHQEQVEIVGGRELYIDSMEVE